MLLFFSPVFNLLSKSEKQAKLVFWGVELVPAADKNKSLQVSGDFHAKLLRFIKYYIDAAIAEMEEIQQPEDKLEPTNSYTEPVGIKIEGDKLDEFTDILENVTSGLDFKRYGDRVIVGITGKEIFGVCGFSDSQIWIEYRLHGYLKSLNIDLDDILAGTPLESEQILITDSHTIRASKDYTPQKSHAYNPLHDGELPTPTPQAEDKIESPYSSKEEIVQIEAAFNKISENRQQSTEKILEASEQKSPEPTLTSEANEVSVSKNDVSFPKPETEKIFDELKSDSLKDRMLGCQNKAELEKLKAENPEKAIEVWESLTVPEKNLVKCINAAINKKSAIPFEQIQWRDAYTKLCNARYMGFYLHGKQVKDNERVIYLIDSDTCKIVDKGTLKGIAKKSQIPCPPDLVAKLEKALSEPVETAISPQNEPDTAPTADEIAANTFTGLAPAPKQQNGSDVGSQPDSQSSKPNDVVEPGDLVKVTAKDSYASGKSVEVDFIKPDGTIKTTWEGKNVYVPKGGYQLEIKNIQNLTPKA